MYEAKKLTFPPNMDYEFVHKSPSLLKKREYWTSSRWFIFDPKTLEAARRRKLHGYLGAVSQVDYAVGQMLDYIRSAGLADNTIVVYSADHGDYACEHGIMEKAPGICHDAITRIPMIWWAPGRFREGHVAEELVESVDVGTTLCALAGLDRPETSDGYDISSLLAGKHETIRDLGVTEFPWSRSVRQGDWRYVWYARDYYFQEYPDGFGELYNLADDPWEMKNLYFEPEHQNRIAAMKAALLDWLITTTRFATMFGYWGNKAGYSPNWQRSARYQHEFNSDGKVNPHGIRERLKMRNYL
ncbi:MAG: sulfatase-like hydrolase/transferase [Chitinivibrionales bacterium]|nr:sulfatase-like hydrolase/transferase [Chitinivibrionales bacterium]